MVDQTKNLLIGIFVIAALGIMIYMILFLHPSMGNNEEILHVRFSNIDKVGVGTRVLFAGRPVGEVTAINEIEDARLQKEIREGEIYIYELTLRLDSGIKVYTSDEIAAKTSGLLGEKSVSITPLPPKPGEKLVLVTTDMIVYATSPPSVDDAIKQFNALANRAQKAMDKVNDDLDMLTKNQFFENLSNIAENLSDVTDALNRPDDITDIVKSTKSLVTGLDDIQRKLNNSWPKIDSSIDNIKEFTASLNNENSTLGRLTKRDDLYLRTTSVMSKAETLMDDINHYGLLFHNDKNWQRLRARRINLMARLSSPQEFRNFFNDEVDQISTSLARLSMVLKDTTNCDYLPILCSPEFERVFADLLRRVTGLEDNLKLFDQQVVEKREEECEPTNPCPLPFEQCEPIIDNCYYPIIEG